MNHREIRTRLYEYIRGEVDEHLKKEMDEHLRGCNRCYAELQVLKEGARLVQPPRTKPSDERSEAFWHNFTVNVEQRIKSAEKKAVVSNPLWETLESLFVYRRPAFLGVLGGLALVVLLLSVIPFNRTVEQSEMMTKESLQTAVQQVDYEVGDYLRKSKILLVGIANMHSGDVGKVDLSVERQVAQSLVQQARTIDSRELDQRSKVLIQALEKILIELANLEDRADVPDVELIRSGIRQENMLFKIRMAEGNYNQSQVTTASRINDNQ